MKKCIQSGKCCFTTDHIPIDKNDIARWEKKGLYHLFTPEMLQEWDYFGVTGMFKNEHNCRCPFLKKVRGQSKYYCRIYSDRPNVCKNFKAGSDHAKAFSGCPAI